MKINTYHMYGNQWLTVFVSDKATHKFLSNNGISVPKILGYRIRIALRWIKDTAKDLAAVVRRAL